MGLIRHDPYTKFTVALQARKKGLHVAQSATCGLSLPSCCSQGELHSLKPAAIWLVLECQHSRHDVAFTSGSKEWNVRWCGLLFGTS